jgi:hypothetical protein
MKIAASTLGLALATMCWIGGAQAQPSLLTGVQMDRVTAGDTTNTNSSDQSNYASVSQSASASNSGAVSASCDDDCGARATGASASNYSVIYQSNSITQTGRIHVD